MGQCISSPAPHQATRRNKRDYLSITQSAEQGSNDSDFKLVIRHIRQDQIPSSFPSLWLRVEKCYECMKIHVKPINPRDQCKLDRRHTLRRGPVAHYVADTGSISVVTFPHSRPINEYVDSPAQSIFSRGPSGAGSNHSIPSTVDSSIDEVNLQESSPDPREPRPGTRRQNL